MKAIRKWWLHRRLRNEHAPISASAILLERVRLWLAEANVIAGERTDTVADSIDKLLKAAHICPTCKYLDGTCLFGLDQGFDKVVNCNEYDRKANAI